MGGVWAVIPIKRMSLAKQRLAPVLNAGEREALMKAMAQDVLATVSEVRELAGIAVVAGDEDGLRLARDVGAVAIEDPSSRSQSEAVTLGVSRLLARNVAAVLALPADIPMATAAEIAFVARCTASAAFQPPGRALTLVPSRNGDGSNAVGVSPLLALTYSFGTDSRRRHAAAALAAGLHVRELNLPGIGLDIDGPDDLNTLLCSGSAGLTHALLAESGIAARLGGRSPSMAAE